MSIHGAVPSTSTPRAVSPGAVGRPAPSAATAQKPSLPTAVSARGLTRSYQTGITGCSARVDALRGVDLDIESGAVLGVLGPPGSGKSTLLLCLAGLLKSDAGTIAWFGRPSDDGGRPPGIVYVPERTAHYSFMTVREAIEYRAVLRDGAARAAAGEIERALAGAALLERATSRIASLPWEARPQLSIAEALAAAPRLLMLDETLDGLNPEARRHICRTLRELAASGASLVVASRSLDVIRGVGDRVATMIEGRLSPPVLASTLARSPVLELTITAPAVARRLPGARVAEDAPVRQVLRVPMEGTTAEAILSRCHACGIRVEASRVVMDEPGH